MPDVTVVSSKRTPPKYPKPAKRATTRNATPAGQPAKQKHHEDMVRAGYVPTGTGYRSTGASSSITSRNIQAVRSADLKAAGNRTRAAQKVAATKKAAVKKANLAASGRKAARADAGGAPRAVPYKKVSRANVRRS